MDDVSVLYTIRNRKCTYIHIHINTNAHTKIIINTLFFLLLMFSVPTRCAASYVGCVAYELQPIS